VADWSSATHSERSGEVANSPDQIGADQAKRAAATAATDTGPGEQADAAEPVAVEGSQGAPAAAAGNETPASPFPRRIPAPEFPQNMTWINAARPLRLADLKGKFVLLDFWTYCCINCIHILPELKKLERAYPTQLVVIGVHSAKFDTERGSDNITEAVLRYEIEHPVVNDHDHRIWDMYAVRSWPTMYLIDPEGNVVYGRSGEFQFQEIDHILKAAIPYYRSRNLLNETPIPGDLVAERQQATPLRFPGKVLADEKQKRLYVADSNHNRIVVAALDGTLLEVIGTGSAGGNDGAFDEATFDHPQGMAIAGDALYVADTENHLLRKVDLRAKRVSTIAGIGAQARANWPESDSPPAEDGVPQRWVGAPNETAINSPWALWVHGQDLFIAMAGPHQIWKMSLVAPRIGPYAGNGIEDIVDGPLLPQAPYELGASSFAQPSGLASDGQWLLVADSEGSSIRAVPLDPAGQVQTIVGTADLPYGRLFTFGDKDGDLNQALLQHPLGLVCVGDKIYVADTYNNKIKLIDRASGTVTTVAGTGKPGRDDQAGTFDEPSGISYAAGKLYVADTNNHLIRTIDFERGNQVATLVIKGLTPPSVTPNQSTPR
jgi:DNA-binding beta-propeller fold protein YncE